MSYCKLHLSLFSLRRYYCVNANKVAKSTAEPKKLKNLVHKKPVQSKIDLSKLPPRTKIDVDTIALLERLSLVNCANRQGIETLEEAIAFADRIQQIDTEGVQPLVTVLEDFPLEVRQQDIPIETSKEEILGNAVVTEDDYFVAPPGNIPLEPREDLLHEKETKKGPVGTIFQENLRNEWLQSVVIGSRDFNVFLSGPSFVDSFEHARQMSLERVPFGIAEFLQEIVPQCENITLNSNPNNEKKDNEQVDFRNVHLNEGNSDVVLRNTTFIPKSDSIPFFHKWQRQRKMWWRKISASPGRYNLTDIQEKGNGCQSVDIKSDFPWGSQVVESISIYTCEHNRLQPHHLQVKDGKKKIRAYFIVSNVCLSSMVLNFICDAYEEPPYQEDIRPMMRIHRKLAPYKIAFTLSSYAGTINDLSDLALYLCKQFRNECMSTLLISNAPRITQEAQWQQYDQMGIPYTVVLNDNTLRNGIALLRSRDTTLKEQVHISTILPYLQQIFKNY